jgi:hypothetical protein
MKPAGRSGRWAAGLLVLGQAIATSVAGAQVAAPAAAKGGDAGLFDVGDELPVVLQFPVKQLLRDRHEREEVAGTLHYQDKDGRKGSLPVTVRTRGHTRLEICDFPPLGLEFDPSDTDGTPFAGQRRLKMVTQCRQDRHYDDYVRLERLIYVAYGLLTPVALRTRPLSVTFVDSAERMSPLSGVAFLIEDIDDLARRVGRREAKMTELLPEDVDPAQTVLFELFQFMIGNTDWSVHVPSTGDDECCHNARVLRPAKGADGKLVVVPYDFDNAGLIDAEYAAVNPVVGMRRVRQRIYRGLCVRNEYVPGAIARFQGVRPDMESLFEADDLGRAISHRAARYVRSFYRILDDPEEVRARIYDYCRDEPEAGSPDTAAGIVTPASTVVSMRGRLP